MKALALLFTVFLLTAACGVDAPGDCDGSARYADVALSAGVSVCSTADTDQKALIETLLASGRQARDLATLTVDYPLDGSVFPPEIAAPTFLWHDDSGDADRWLVDLTFGEASSHLYVLVPGTAPPQGEIDPQCIANTNELYEPTPYQASAVAWQPSAELWTAIKDASSGRPARVTFYGYRDDDAGQVVSRGTAALTTSTDPVGAPIFYRDVPLMPSEGKDGVIKPLDKNSQPLIAWRLKDIGRTDSRVLLTDMPTCANCHSFSADGATMGMDIDGPDGDKGAYAVAAIQRDLAIDDDQIITWNAFSGRREGHHTLGFLSRVSPDGQYVVSTVNEALYVRNFTSYEFLQVFFPTAGILAYYSRETGEILPLPGADDPQYVHCDAVWTPDGDTLVFARAKARPPYERGHPLAEYAGDPNETRIQYDLYRMPFNGGRGGVPEPIEGASNNGMSNSFPKVSPDGKWIVFVKSKNGQLMRPDGRLWIVPLEGGEARELACNTDLMNSWHSFSPNGRWMVFSSKTNTPYTEMFLTHMDENGNASPPILIENSKAANRAVNIPEFLNVPYDEFTSITVPAVYHYEDFARGNELARLGRHLEAIAEFERALEGRKQEWRIQDWRIHDSMSKSLLQLGRLDEAAAHIRESLAINEYNPEMHANLGYILFLQGDYDGALQHLDFAVRLNPRDPQARYNRATLHLQRGRLAAAAADFTEAIRLAPEYADAYTGRGMTLKAQGDADGALADFSEAIRLDPDKPAPWFFRALVRRDRRDLSGAAEDAARALAVTPPGSPQRAQIEALQRELR
jgi:tetratricopeptide (TPR) repeat protein